MAIIRVQLALAISDQPKRASLEKTLAACGRLKSNSSIYELLSDPKFGWKPLAPTTLCNYNYDRTFASEVQAALFEQWGRLDLDGALKTLGKTRARLGEGDPNLVMPYNLYKGAASAGDGQHVLDTLIPPGSGGGGDDTVCALGFLIEGWARSDPAAAWQTLVSFRPMDGTQEAPIRSYFHGLPPDMNWAALSQKVDDYCAAGQFIAMTDASAARSAFKRNLAASWIRHDPAAALAWFESNCDDRQPGWDSFGNPRVASHAAVIIDWLQTDLPGATQWLATWQSDTISVPEVLAAINQWQQHAAPCYATPDVREAVGKLLQKTNNR